VNLPGEYAPVASIVTNPAKNKKVLIPDAELLLQDKVRSVPCIFHQEFFDNAILFYGTPIQCSHFRNRADFHTLQYLSVLMPRPDLIFPAAASLSIHLTETDTGTHNGGSDRK